MAVTSVPQVIGQSQDILLYNSVGATRVQTYNLGNANAANFGAYNPQSGTLTVNPTNGALIEISNLVANTTVNFVGLPGVYNDAYSMPMYRASTWLVEVVVGSTYTLTFPNVVWDGGTAPSLGTGTVRQTILFTSHDGTTINGKLLYTMAS